MAKQLKVVVENGYTQNAPITVNFAAPVIIEPGSKITLDKFSAVVAGLTTGFTVASTDFDLYLSANSPNYQFNNVQVPAKYYATVAPFLQDLTTYCNNVITGYLPGALPESGLSYLYRDLGLKVGCTTATNNFLIEYVTAPLSTLNMVPSNMVATPFGDYAPTAAGAFSYLQTTETQILLQGGGASATFQLSVPTALEAATDGLDWQVGFLDNNDVLHGLHQNALGELYLYNGDDTVEIDTAFFPDNCYVQLYQADGGFVIRSYTVAGGIETPIYNSSILSANALGMMDYTLSYNFVMFGSCTSATSQKPAINEQVDMTIDVPFSGGTPPAVPVFNRTMAINMTDAIALRAGLNIPPGFILLTPNNSSFGSYLAAGAINMSVVNSAFDFAIEILNIPLETYQASSSGAPGQRNNVIAYFLPALSNVGTSLYTYASSCYQWLNVDISYPLNISSLSFRVYDPATGLDINADSMTFNLMISDKEY